MSFPLNHHLPGHLFLITMAQPRLSCQLEYQCIVTIYKSDLDTPMCQEQTLTLVCQVEVALLVETYLLSIILTDRLIKKLS